MFEFNLLAQIANEDESKVCRISPPYQFKNFQRVHEDGSRLVASESKHLYIARSYDKSGASQLNIIETREADGEQSKHTTYYFDENWGKCLYSEVIRHDKGAMTSERSVFWNDGNLLFIERQIGETKPTWFNADGEEISKMQAEEIFQDAQNRKN